MYKKDIVGNVFCEPKVIKLSVSEVSPYYNKIMNKKYREMPFKKIDIPRRRKEDTIYENILYQFLKICDRTNCYGIKYTSHKNAPFVFYCVKDKGSTSYLYRVTLHNILRGVLL